MLHSRLANGDYAAVDLFAIQARDGGLRFFLVGHLHVSKTGRTTGLGIDGQTSHRHLAKRLESLADILLGGAVSQIADVNAHRTECSIERNE